MKTPIVYYGGKTAILPHILKLIPPHEVYTEVFFGGGTVFFAKDPSFNETINDKLDIVINFYQQLKRNYPALKVLIDESLLSRTTHRQALFMLKNKEHFTNIQLAWAFWYCCNFSFFNKIGGGIKFSNDTSVTVARILQNKKKQFTEDFVTRIENAHIENDDAIRILKSRNVKKAFHYIDPPYVGADQGHYKGYTENDLIDLLIQCENTKGKFLLSHYSNPVLTEFIKRNQWHTKEVSIRLQIIRKSGKAKNELLITNYDPSTLYPQQSFNFTNKNKNQ